MRALEGLATQRLFVGIPVAERTRVALARLLPAVLPGKPAVIGNWHFTLRFLGDTEPVIRDRFTAQLRALRLGREFEIEFDTLGAFPNPRRAAVLWVGVGRGRERLEGIAAKVETAAAASGFAPEKRKFTAHLTLARIRPPQPVVRFLTGSAVIHAVMLVDEVILYESRLGGAHSQYTVIERFALE